MKNVLKPCPFCGCEAELRQDLGVIGPHNWFAICPPCDVIRDQAFLVTKQEAVAAWNTRKEAA